MANFVNFSLNCAKINAFWEFSCIFKKMQVLEYLYRCIQFWPLVIFISTIRVIRLPFFPLHTVFLALPINIARLGRIFSRCSYLNKLATFQTFICWFPFPDGFFFSFFDVETRRCRWGSLHAVSKEVCLCTPNLIEKIVPCWSNHAEVSHFVCMSN